LVQTRLEDRLTAAGDFRLPTSDMELAQAASKGDMRAFSALVDRHVDELFRLALLLSGKRADAEDICQETLLGAFKGVRRFDGRSSIKTWMTRILLRQAAKHWKKNKRHIAKSLDAVTETADDRRAGAIQPQARVTDVDSRADLLAMIARLGPDHQQVVVLRELQGLSYEQISQTLGIPCGTVESRLYRARVELRKLLKDYNA
jgi:RNA polymerase sigma-70 factor, ECF subfamily